jgi:hypothetical protein
MTIGMGQTAVALPALFGATAADEETTVGEIPPAGPAGPWTPVGP